MTSERKPVEKSETCDKCGRTFTPQGLGMHRSRCKGAKPEISTPEISTPEISTPANTPASSPAEKPKRGGWIFD